MISLDVNWGTHLPVLTKLMSITDGPVLEMGTGLYSTPFLHWACFPTKRKLVSYEGSERFFQRLVNCQNDYHDTILVPDWDKIDIERLWDVVLIDHEPTSRRRVDAKRVANYAKYVVLHDSDPRNEKHYHYSEVYPLYKYRFDYTDAVPNTTVLSNFMDLSNFKI